MSKIIEKIKSLGYELPEAPKPVAAYIPAVKTGNLIFTSGVLPMVKGELKYKGKIDGKTNTVEYGAEAARTCALNALSVVNDIVGLDKVKRIVKVTGFVYSAEGFNNQPQVINGASNIIGEIFEEKGKHARSAVGVNELPLQASVELELIVEVKD